MSTTRPVRELRTDGRPGGTIARAMTRIFEGPHPWGLYEVNASRSGVVHYRLTVFPPGTNAAERRALARARDWPVVGAVAALVAIMIFGESLGPAFTTFAALAVYAIGVVWTRLRSRGIRSAVRSVDAVQVYDGVRNVTRGELGRILVAVATLRTLDEDERAGRIDEVGYEARWAAVYHAVDEGSTRATDLR